MQCFIQFFCSPWFLLFERLEMDKIAISSWRLHWWMNFFLSRLFSAVENLRILQRIKAGNELATMKIYFWTNERNFPYFKHGENNINDRNHVIYSFLHGWIPNFMRRYLKGEGINQKKRNMWTTSFGRSFMGNQHCNGRCNHLGSAASFVQNQRLAYKLVDTDFAKCA